ncbi:hypothetical protein MKW92_002914, partial [Papaver armeniacum]
MFIKQILLVQFCFCLLLSTSLDAFEGAKPGCPDKCGGVSIPYPFGITREGGGGGCSIGEVGHGYNVNCNSSYNPPRPFIGTTNNLQILSISETEIRVANRLNKLCFDERGVAVYNDSKVYMSVRRTPFTFSNTKNKFFLIGCNSVGVYQGSDQEDRESLIKCTSSCDSRGKVVEGSCGGNGCCQKTIPRGIKHFQTTLTNADATNLFPYSPCSYIFLGEYEQLKFNASDLLFVPKNRDIPVVLDWAVGSKTCEEAQKDPTTYACHGNSHCNNSDNNPGYHCTCFEGYKGNPYLSPGCEDINECEDQKTNPCEGICTNTNGSYICTCPAGSQGNGKNDGRVCTTDIAKRDTPDVAKREHFPIIQVTLAMPCIKLKYYLRTSTFLMQ